MKKIFLSLASSLLIITGQSQILRQDVSFTFDDNNLVPSGNYIFEARDFNVFKPHSEYIPTPGNSLVARINPYLLFPPPDDSLGGPNPGDNGLVGTLPVSLDVTPSGAANYSIPLDLPTGVVGMQPNLTLSYSSQGGNGIFGMGWSISGLSSISRTSTNLYNDGSLDAMDFDDNDKLKFDGNRLMTDGTYFSVGAEYYTEIETFSKIQSINGADGDPGYFKVWAKDGKILYYGFTEDSRVEASSIGKAYTWLLSRIEDRQGNYIKYSYINDEVNGVSRIDKIEYTGNSSVSPVVEPFYTIKFVPEQITNGRVDINEVYFSSDADKWGKLAFNDRIEYIDILYNNTSLKKYHLEYTDDLYTHLSKVTLIGSDGTQLNPTTFEWGVTSNNITIDHSLNFGDYHYFFSDYNGDGLTDYCRIPWILTPTNHHAEFFFNEGNGIYLSTASVIIDLDLTFSNFYPNTSFYYTSGNFSSGNHDFNGDGKNDIVIVNSFKETIGGQLTDMLIYNAMYYSRGDNTFKNCFNTQFKAIQDHNPQVLFGDLNGDGRDDLFVYDPILKEFSIMGFGFSFFSQSFEMPGTFRGVGDFNGDGKVEIMMTNNSNTTIYELNNNYAFDIVYNRDFPTINDHIFFGDFNGDGKLDFLSYNATDRWRVNYSTGNNFISKSFYNPYDWNDDPLFGEAPWFVADFNGDGKSDLCYLMCNSSWGGTYNCQVQYFLSNGVDLVSQPLLNYTVNATFPIFKYDYFLGDFNGDGQWDLLHRLENTPSTSDIIEYDPNSQKHLLHGITDGLGKQNLLTYSPLSDKNIYQEYPTSYFPNYPILELRKSLYVVNTIKTDNGKGGWLEENYGYKESNIHLRGKGFLCFHEVSKSNTTLQTKETKKYSFDQATYYAYVTSSGIQITSCTPHLSIAYTDYENVIHHYSAQHIFPYVAQSNSKSHELDVSTITYIKTTRATVEYSTDDILYGNPTKITTLNDAQDIDPSFSNDLFTFKEEVTKTYYPVDITNWITGNVNLITTQSSIKNKGSQTKTQQFYYYPVGDYRSQLLSRSIKEPGLTDPLSLVTDLDYDKFGNTITKLETAPNANPPIPNRLTKYDSDPLYQSRFITKITDPLDHVTEIHFNPTTGKQISVKGINNLTTTYSNSLLGSYAQSQTPDGTQNIKVMRWVNGQTEAPNDALFYSWEQTSGNSEHYTYYDKLGRTLREVSKGFNNRSIFVDQQYDVFGRITKTSDPYFSGDTKLYTENKYNTTFSRVDYKVFPDQTHLWYSYNGLTTTTTNESGHSNIKKINAIGLLDESTDPNSKTVKFDYSYSGNDFITTTAIQGYSETQTTIQIDKFGNRTKIIDPSSGTIYQEYDAFGDLISSRNQKQNEQTKTLFTYDKLGRMISRVEDGKQTTWRYDTKPFGTGKLDLVSNTDNSIEYFYDELSRLTQKNEVIAGESKIFSYKYTYDPFSRLDEQTYPSDIIIRNKYDKNGILYKITEVDRGTETLWETTTINAKGQLTQANLGNSITTNYNYQANTGHLNSIQSYANNTVLQDLEYQWDELGNLSDRKKWIDRSQGLFLDESFQYDVLDRLTTVTLNNQITSNIDYDDLGNLTAKPPLSNMTYGAQNSGPYAITEANFSSGAIPTNPQDITYTIFDKISTISEGASDLALTYGVDHQRIKQIIHTNDELVSTKYYIGGLCEKITDDKGTRFLNYVNGPMGLCAIIVKHDNGQSDINFILKDHLGSLDCITDKTGLLLEELSFDPWGRRRNPIDWTYANIPTTFLFDRGFTGHEHLDLFGLINMNGRAYDPVVGRFLSTDNTVQSPGNSQSYNRYSYCLNNPLRFTDPSGYNWLNDAWGWICNNWKPIVTIVATVVVAVVVGVATAGLGDVVLVGLIAGAAGGFTAGVVGTALNGGNLGQCLEAGFSGALQGAIFGALGGAAASLAPAGGLLGGLYGAGTGFVLGGASSKVNGGSFWQGAIMGAALGGVGGGIAGYYSAQARGLNPWTGAQIARPETPITPMQPIPCNTLSSDNGLKVPEELYHYTQSNPADWKPQTIGSLEWDDKRIWLTPNGELSSSEAVEGLGIKAPNYMVKINTLDPSFDPSKVIVIQNVRSACGYETGQIEVIYQGPLDISNTNVVITRLPK